VRIAGLIGSVSLSDPEHLDGDHDHTECVAQAIIGEKNVRSHILNGLLGRADQTNFFTDYTLTVQSGGSFVLEVRHQQAPPGRTLSPGHRSQSAHLYFTNHTLTGKLAAFPSPGLDSAGRFRRLRRQ
jgi:hypothetical protein